MKKLKITHLVVFSWNVLFVLNVFSECRIDCVILAVI